MRPTALRLALAIGLVVGAAAATRGQEGEPPLPPPPPPPPPAAEATFTLLAPPKGTVRHATTRMVMDLTLEVKQNGEVVAPATRTRSETTTELVTTVLEGDEIGPRKLEARFVRRQEETAEGDEKRSETSSVQGKTFVLEMKEDDIAITKADGTAASDEEALICLEDTEEAFDPTSGHEFLDGRTVRVGETVVPEEEFLANLFRNEEGLEAKKASFKLVGLEGVDAAFDAAITLVGDDGDGLRTTVELSGRIVLRTTDLWVSSLSMKGPVRYEGSSKDRRGSMETRGTGTAEMTAKVTYSRAEGQ